MDLKSRLIAAAEAWRERMSAAESQPVSLARLSKAAVSDEKFFARLDDMRRGPTTDTLEKFARFLSDPDNWVPARNADPEAGAEHEEGIPKAALQFCHAVLGSAGTDAVSPDSSHEIIASSDDVAPDPSRRIEDQPPGGPASATQQALPGGLFPEGAA